MCLFNNGKRKTINDGRHRTIRPEESEHLKEKKITNTWEYWKQTRRDERKELKKNISGERENNSKPNYIA